MITLCQKNKFWVMHTMSKSVKFSFGRALLKHTSIIRYRNKYIWKEGCKNSCFEKNVSESNVSYTCCKLELHSKSGITNRRCHEKTSYVSNYASLLYSINGSIEGRYINWKNSVCNFNFIARSAIIGVFLIDSSALYRTIHAINWKTHNLTHRRFFRDDEML